MNTIHLRDIPDVILILGTDAAGKDHVANILAGMIQMRGGQVEKRKRFFSGCVTTEENSEGKGWFDSLQEKVFLALYPYLGRSLVYLLHVVTKRDLKKYRSVNKKLIIVGHNGVRGLAFYLGNKLSDIERLLLPEYFVRTFREVQEKTGVHTIVLDVADEVRKKRIQDRVASGTEDNFDKYMARDGQRSERIEECLVQLAVSYMKGALIENNDLTESELTEQMVKGFSL